MWSFRRCITHKLETFAGESDLYRGYVKGYPKLRLYIYIYIYILMNRWTFTSETEI